MQGKDQGRHGRGPGSAVGNDFLLSLPQRCLVPSGCPGMGAVPSSLHQRFFSAPQQALMGSSQASGVPGDLFSAQRDSYCLFSDSESKWGPQFSLTWYVWPLSQESVPVGTFPNHRLGTPVTCYTGNSRVLGLKGPGFQKPVVSLLSGGGYLYIYRYIWEQNLNYLCSKL